MPSPPGPRGLTSAFLDRDGTLNRKAPEGDYVKSVPELVALPRAPEAVALLKSAGLRVVVVTNQRGIALGRMTEQDLSRIHSRLREVIGEGGGDLDAIYHCPHAAGTCGCRKPDVGMFLRARDEHPATDFSSSVVVGDSLTDMEPGSRLGMTTVLIAGDGAAARAAAEERGIRVDHVVPSLWDAATWLTGADPSSPRSV